MKTLDINWTSFFAGLEAYRTLSPETRAFFLREIKPSQPVPNRSLVQWPQLLASGLLTPSQTGVNASVALEYREFSRAMRAMFRSEVLASPDIGSFHRYIADNLTTEEINSLGGPGTWGRLDDYNLRRIYSAITSTSWPKGFLSADGTEWETSVRDQSVAPYFFSGPILKSAQQLLTSIAEANGPVLISTLPTLFPDPGGTLGAGLRGALRYLLLFAGLSGNELEPIVGLWPGVAEKISGEPPALPTGVAVDEPFHSAYAVDDMMAILSACAVDPIRIRSGDMEIFEAARQSLTAALGTLPEWVERTFHVVPAQRIENALDFLVHFGLLKQAGRPGSNFRFETTEAAAKWLAMEPRQRLRMLMDGLRGSLKTESSLYADEVMTMIPGVYSMGSRGDAAKLIPWILKAYASAGPGEFARLEDFLRFEARTNNGLAALVAKNRYFSLRIGNSYINSPSEGEAERAWQDLLFGFLTLRLLPLGGVQLGVEAGGKAVCFLVTDAGRYLVGARDDFDLPAEPAARILVQPNFDVVFLAPSARVESEIARFAERTGRHVGTLFRITKSSILGGAAAGLSPEGVLTILRENCAQGIPPNVAAEIVGWFGRYRRVGVRSAMLMHCPDAETAVRIMAAMGKKVTRLTETSLELHDTKIQPAAAKKLREAGVFVVSE